MINELNVKKDEMIETKEEEINEFGVFPVPIVIVFLVVFPAAMDMLKDLVLLFLK
jgi:hypothetical protein